MLIILEEDVPDCDCDTMPLNSDECVVFPIINEDNHTLECMPLRRSLPIHTDSCSTSKNIITLISKLFSVSALKRKCTVDPVTPPSSPRTPSFLSLPPPRRHPYASLSYEIFLKALNIFWIQFQRNVSKAMLSLHGWTDQPFTETTLKTLPLFWERIPWEHWSWMKL